MEQLEVTFKYNGIEFEYNRSITEDVDLYIDYDKQFVLLVSDTKEILTIVKLEGDTRLNNAYLDIVNIIPVNNHHILQKFNVTFKHSVLKDYKFVVEAYTMREARNKVSLMPFYEDCEVNIQPV